MSYSYLAKVTYENDPSGLWEVLAGKPDGGADQPVDGKAIGASDFGPTDDIASVTDGVNRPPFPLGEDDRVYLIDSEKLRVYHIKDSMNFHRNT
jgi:hypothetical protein